VRWRTGVIWYILALGLPVALTLLSVYLNVLFGAPAPTPEQLSAWPDLLFFFPFAFLLLGAAEELGWRGFAQHTLQETRPALVATLIVAAMAIVWHLPLMIAGRIPVSDILFIVTGYIVVAWLYNSAGHSVLIVMLFHAMLNTISGEFFSPMFDGPDAERLAFLRAALYGVVALVLIAATSPQRLSSRASSPAPAETQAATNA
jgi:membrane protease YdiL (CAAX protease family)